MTLTFVTFSLKNFNIGLNSDSRVLARTQWCSCFIYFLILKQCVAFTVEDYTSDDKCILFFVLNLSNFRHILNHIQRLLYWVNFCHDVNREQ